MNFCFIRLFTAGTTGCVGCTHITLSFSVGVGDALVYPKIVTISTISCVGHTVIYFLLFTFSYFGLLLGICNDQYNWLRWSYCYLLAYYLLLAVLAFYSVFVTISMIGCVGRTVIYLSIIYF